MHSQRFCGFLISICLKRSGQVINKGWNPLHIDFYCPCTDFFSACHCARKFSWLKNGGFDKPMPASKALWLYKNDVVKFNSSLWVYRGAGCIWVHVSEVLASLWKVMPYFACVSLVCFGNTQLSIISSNVNKTLYMLYIIKIVLKSSTRLYLFYWLKRLIQKHIYDKNPYIILHHFWKLFLFE